MTGVYLFAAPFLLRGDFLHPAQGFESRHISEG